MFNAESPPAWLRSADRITVLTGAGISTDSGIPDWRGPNGLWTLSPSPPPTLESYLADPDVRRHAWSGLTASPMWSARPNPGHEALVDLERQGRLRTLITQNTDRLHLTAGNAAGVLVELHGNDHQVQCQSCGDRQPTIAVLEQVRAGDRDPRCPLCGGILKTTSIMFGEEIDDALLRTAEDAVIDCDVFIAAGTSLRVAPASWFPTRAADAGVRVIIATGQPTDADNQADLVVRAPLSQALPDLLGGLLA